MDRIAPMRNQYFYALNRQETQGQILPLKDAYRLNRNVKEGLLAGGEAFAGGDF